MLTPREHALRVTALDALSAAAKGEYERARKEAEGAFALARKEGARQQEVLLPTGEKVGLIAIKEGRTVTIVDDAALLGFVEGVNPAGIEEYIDPEILKREDVAEVIRGVFPELVGKRVRTATRAAYVTEAEAAGGWLVNEESGEKTRVAEITKSEPTGDFAFSGGKTEQRRAATMDALRSDPELRAQLLGGALALDAADGGERGE